MAKSALMAQVVALVEKVARIGRPVDASAAAIQFAQSAMIPAAKRIALEKRAMSKALMSQGFSRTAAMRAVSQKYRNGGNGIN